MDILFNSNDNQLRIKILCLLQDSIEGNESINKMKNYKDSSLKNNLFNSIFEINSEHCFAIFQPDKAELRSDNFIFYKELLLKKYSLLACNLILDHSNLEANHI